jgi:hypothetical protein
MHDKNKTAMKTSQQLQGKMVIISSNEEPYLLFSITDEKLAIKVEFCMACWPVHAPPEWGCHMISHVA